MKINTMHSTVITCSTFLCLLTVYQPHIFDLSLKLKYIILSSLSGLFTPGYEKDYFRIRIGLTIGTMVIFLLLELFILFTENVHYVVN